MNSGQWITAFMLSFIPIFTIWELVQLYRRSVLKNASARTASQYVIKRAKEGSKFYKVVVIGFPVFIFLVSVWLMFHWFSFCFAFNLFCEIDI